MKFKATACIMATLGAWNANSSPAPEVCVGTPWQVCSGISNATAYSSYVRVQTLNGQTYNNVRFSLTAIGDGAAPTIVSHPNCTSATTTEATGCTLFPNTGALVTGIQLGGVTINPMSNYLFTVSRRNSDGTYVNLVQTKIEVSQIN